MNCWSAPFRESAHLLLMRTLAARGNVAEALAAYERLRILLRDERQPEPGHTGCLRPPPWLAFAKVSPTFRQVRAKHRGASSRHLISAIS